MSTTKEYTIVIEFIYMFKLFNISVSGIIFNDLINNIVIIDQQQNL